MPTTEADIRAKARKLAERSKHLNEVPAQLIEVENEDGISSVYVRDDTNLVWIMLYDDSARPAQAWNCTTQYRAGAPVWVRKLPDNTLEVVRIRARDGTELYGVAAGTMNTPALIGELMPGTIWPGRNLMPGLMRYTDAGGLIVYVEPFHYDGGYFPGGTFDLTPNVPATANTKAWVKVWINTADNSIGATTGTEVDIGLSPMQESDLAAISIDASYIPVAGIVLENGQTTIDSTTLVVDARQWLNAPATPSQYMPVILDYDLTIPTNRQVPVRRLQITTGTLTVLGVLDIF